MTTLTVLFISVSTQFGLPQNMLNSLCFVESTHDVNAVHHDDGGSDSLGVCQVKLETAQWLGFRGTAKQLMNPKVNVYYAGKYLHYQLLRYSGNPTKAIISYNRGNANGLTQTEYSDKVNKQWRAENESSKGRFRQMY